MPRQRRKFRDTGLGSWLADKSPRILDVAGDLLPDQGVLGIVKRLIDTDEAMSPEDRAEAHARLVELYSLEVSDRDSARKREVGVAQFKRFDLMFLLTGIVGLSAFVFIVYAIAYLTIPENNKEMWIHLIGICEGIVVSIFGYYFGSAVKQAAD